MIQALKLLTLLRLSLGNSPRAHPARPACSSEDVFSGLEDVNDQ